MDVATVTLSLGMPRDKVLESVKRAGYKFMEINPVGKETRIAVTNTDIDKDMVQRAVALVDNDGELSFRDGVLVRIHRQVAASTINTDRDLALALYAVIQGLEKEGSNHICYVRTIQDTPSIDNPGIDAKTIELDCSAGKEVYRNISIRWVTMEGSKDQLHVRVFQELGKLQRLD